VKLGTRLSSVNSGSKRRLTEVDDTFQYVPLLRGLQILLGHEDIRDEVSYCQVTYKELEN
jgi:hypothetical protein